MGRLVKCQYTHCLHDGKVDRDLALAYNSKYYHKDCYEMFQIMLNIRDLCFQVDPTIVFKQLNGYINKLVYEKNIDPEYIIFTLEFIIRNNLEVNLPYGLIYKLNDFNVKNAYKNVSIQKKLIIHSS